MGIFVADRKFLGEIGVLDEGMKVYGGENVELGIRVSTYHVKSKSNTLLHGVWPNWSKSRYTFWFQQNYPNTL